MGVGYRDGIEPVRDGGSGRGSGSESGLRLVSGFGIRQHRPIAWPLGWDECHVPESWLQFTVTDSGRDDYYGRPFVPRGRME